MKFNLPKGICHLELPRGNPTALHIKYPYKKVGGVQKRKTEKVCAFPLTKKQRKEAKELVESLAKKRAVEYYEYEKYGKEPEHLKQQKPTFQDIAERYMSAMGMEAIPLSIKDCLEAFGGRIADSITPLNVEDFLKSMLTRKVRQYRPHSGTYETLNRYYEASTINTRLSIIKEISKYAKKGYLVEKDPTKGVKMFPIKSRQKHIPYDDFLDIVAKLNSNPQKTGRKSNNVANAATMAFFTGMRKNEVLGLTWDRAKLNEPIPHIILNEEHTKTKQPRKVPLMPNLVEMLKDIRKVEHIHDKRVFPITYLNPTWNRALKNLYGERLYRFHDCRSSFVTNMASFGVLGEYRRKITGHVSIDTHEDYLQPTLEDLYREVLKVYEGMVAEESKVDLATV